VQINEVAEVLTGRGHSVEIVPTTAPGSAISQAREAAFADVIFACGGDGTIHEVLQGLVSETGEPVSTLGIIPLGSANALARHLHLSLDPRKAALQQIAGERRTIPVGKISYADDVRYFTVMAGAGPDGALTYSLLTSHKSRLGRMAYYLHAVRLLATRRFHPFEVEVTRSTPGPAIVRKAVSVMSARVDSLGGAFNGLTSNQASVHDRALQLVILSPPALISLPLWVLSGWFRANRLNPFLRCVDAASFSCRPLKGSVPHFQADGEWLGRLPLQVSLVPNAVRVLLPADEK
jgi:YegS/Rv2252/BmrU family lipid kinase